jgi:hypothetical protein
MRHAPLLGPNTHVTEPESMMVARDKHSHNLATWTADH